MNAAARAAACAVYKYSGALFAQEALARLRGRSFAAVLLFHRVTAAIPRDGLTVDPAGFRAVCRMLRHNFRVVPLAEVFRLARQHRPIPRRTVAVTFDDTYRDNLSAARVLAEHRLPATFFVSTGYVGTDRVAPWDRHLPRMANLTWDDLREVVSLGFEIGSHTVHHPDLGRTPPGEARRELADSKRTLEERLGRPVRYFAFPYGGREHIPPDGPQLVQEAGYEGCLSAHGGFVRPGHAVEALPRVAVPYFRSALHLEVFLAGGLGWYYALKRRACPDSPPFVQPERAEFWPPRAEVVVGR